MTRRLGLLIALAIPFSASAQRSPLIEIQAYPAGFVGVVGLSWSLTGDWDAHAFGGYNLTRRRDWGEHDDERGGGPGGGLAIRRDLGRWYAGARIDVWRLSIDWEDDARGTTGTTDVVVFQPTARFGRTFGSRFDLGTALGAEVNVSTDGEDVGQGAIFLVGVGIRL